MRIVLGIQLSRVLVVTTENHDGNSYTSYLNNKMVSKCYAVVLQSVRKFWHHLRKKWESPRKNRIIIPYSKKNYMHTVHVLSCLVVVSYRLVYTYYSYFSGLLNWRWYDCPIASEVTLNHMYIYIAGIHH